jgi:hypothetical protein
MKSATARSVPTSWATAEHASLRGLYRGRIGSGGEFARRLAQWRVVQRGPMAAQADSHLARR